MAATYPTARFMSNCTILAVNFATCMTEQFLCLNTHMISFKVHFCA